MKKRTLTALIVLPLMIYVVSKMSTTLKAGTDDGLVVSSNAYMFVLDISGSMSGSPLAGVKSTISQAVSKIKSSSYTGLVSFSGCGSQHVKLEVPLAKRSGKKVIARANALRASGGTDIGLALAMAEKEVAKLPPHVCAKIFLMSDGEDSCNNSNAGDTAKRISEMNDCHEVNTISIGVGDWESEIFEDIAEKGNGHHQNVEEPNDILDDIIAEIEEEEVIGKDPEWRGEYDPKNPDGKKPPKGTGTGGTTGEVDTGDTGDEAEAEIETEEENQGGGSGR